jgi:hypothetical protein
MQHNGARLRALLDEEAAGSDDHSPAGEAAIRAHLRLVAEALAANAGPSTRAGLEELAGAMPARLDAARDELDAERELLADAAAHELDLQFGAAQAAHDPLVREVTQRRLGVQAWTRVFLRRVGEAVGDDAVARAALEWMSDRQDDLANLIFTMDRRAKEGEIARRGPDAVDDPDVANRIGQAAVLQAHMRFLVEAIAATLGAPRA